jgi:transcriptional regulator with XRE-family HTH domain
MTLNCKGIGLRCMALRLRAGVDEREAAERSGITVRTWRNLERGRPHRTETFLKVGRAFGCSLDWLATGAGVRL